MDQNESEVLAPAPIANGAHPTQRRPSEEEASQLTRIEASRGGLAPTDSWTETIRGFGEYGIRGAASMALLCKMTDSLEGQVQELKREKKEAEGEARTWHEAYYSKMGEVNVLLERLQSRRNVNLATDVLLTTGGLLFGVTTQNLQEGFRASVIASLALGLGLIIAGWAVSLFSKERK